MPILTGQKERRAMSESFSPAITLSPGFDKARRISRFLSIILLIGFWVLVAVVVISLLMLSLPDSVLLGADFLRGHGSDEPSFFYYVGRAMPYLLFLMLGVPWAFVLHHGRRVFVHF